MRKLGLVLGLCLLSPLAWALPNTNTNVVTKTSATTGGQSATVFWTPASGSYIALMGCVVSSDSQQNTRIQSAGVDVIAPLYFTTSVNVVYLGGGATPLWVGGTNATLTYTTAANFLGPQSLAGNRNSVTCFGYEVP